MTKILHPLAKMRKRELMSVKDLCIKLECSPTTIRAFEGGDRDLTDKRIEMVCEIFDRSEAKLRRQIEEWKAQKGERS